MKVRAIMVGAVVLIAAAAGTILITRDSGAVAPAPEKAAGSGAEGPLVSKTGPHPKAVVANRVFDFGVMGVNEKRSHTFEIENRGEAPLVLKAGKPTCKCTISGLDRDEVPVGGTAHVKLEWEPKDPQLRFEQTAPIHTNDPENNPIELRIVGEVARQLIIEPPGNWNLGDVGEEPVTVSGAIFSRVLDTFAIKSVESNNELLTVEHAPMTEDELKSHKATSGYTLRATLAPGTAIGSLSAGLTIKTDVNDGADFVLSLSGNRPGPIRFLAPPGTDFIPEAMAVNLGEFPASEGKKARLILFVGGMDEEFRVTKIDSDTPFLKVELDRVAEFQPGTKQRLELRFEVPPDSPSTTKIRSGASRVTIHTNHPKAPEMKFRVEMISF